MSSFVGKRGSGPSASWSAEALMEEAMYARQLAVMLDSFARGVSNGVAYRSDTLMSMSAAATTLSQLLKDKVQDVHETSTPF